MPYCFLRRGRLVLFSAIFCPPAGQKSPEQLAERDTMNGKIHYLKISKFLYFGGRPKW